MNLVDDLRRLGLETGDTVMVHASLRSVGAPADVVLDALMDVIGPRGTVVMNLGSRNDWDWVNDHAEHERPALLVDAEPFDHRSTPADPDVGVLAEVLRQRPGVVVGDHPDARFGALGARAAALVDDVPWNDYYGAGSSLERIVEVGGRVLRLGADLDTVTLLHLAEYRVDLPQKRRVRRHCRVRSAAGSEVRVVECLDDSNGIVDHPGEDYFATIVRDYLATGRALTGMVGRAPSELVDAADLLEFATSWMARHLAN